MAYPWLRSLLFHLPPETAHHLTLSTLSILYRLTGGSSYLFKNDIGKEEAIDQFGLKFPNRIGLAAGLDKDAKYVDALASLGFGFVEIGTVTPRPQKGNPQPRLFRLPEDKAIINRMGFNNDGAKAVAERLRKRKSKIIVGGNIGKNKNTPNDQAIDDYQFCFQTLHPHVDYFVINVSSPNTAGLRELQDKKPLKKILTRLQKENRKQSIPKPLLLKIAPDLTHTQLDDILDLATSTKLDGLIATNTTISREHLTADQNRLKKIGQGGLSGKPLTDPSTSVIRYLYKHKHKELGVIGVGGIMSAQDALEKIDAGASLVQLYTGLIYEGPGLITTIRRALINRLTLA